ncbi:hypothetical protein [Ruminiclostridium cellulolyticum]|uniref:Copper amine oxidase-like N-terminal domain-containing protein n=1 Tax=Ruminiclostridium cellulolyticum (strain ATCC 35319 / DSM 5812 / JCM 6584 / H10) TaxID=394503 RepID=B8I112_RUMCH|nr:hypothetical protein [Ruminiclostridium cellulolyticum]ACL77568.1 hypothetical protein Ccel_3279 [Ruminiclostridium cellulolyticum H10]
MKKFFAGLITGIIVAISFTAFAAVQLKVVPNPYPVYINNVKSDVSGYNINGSTYLKTTDFKSAGLDVKYNKNKKQIEVKSTTTGLTNNNSGTTGNNQNPVFLYEGDAKDTTYRGYKAILYNGDTFINAVEFLKKLKMTIKYNTKQDSYQFYKNEVKILETLNSTSEYYIVYENRPYFNVKFLGEYLEG